MTFSFLNFLQAVPKWIAILYLKDKDLKILLSIMAGVLYSSTVFTLTYPAIIKKSIENYGWFGYVKRISLLLGLLAYALIYYHPSYFSQKFTQFILFINVAEAGLLAIQNDEYIIGMLMLTISPFTPKMLVSKITNTVIAVPGNIFGFSLITMSVDTYFKCHYSLLLSLYLFGNYFSKNRLSIWAGMTCIVPLIVDEFDKYNHGSNFLIRTMMLILGTIVDTTIDPGFMEKTYFKTNYFENERITRNLVQLIIPSLVLVKSLLF